MGVGGRQGEGVGVKSEGGGQRMDEVGRGRRGMPHCHIVIIQSLSCTFRTIIHIQ